MSQSFDGDNEYTHKISYLENGTSIKPPTGFNIDVPWPWESAFIAPESDIDTAYIRPYNADDFLGIAVGAPIRKNPREAWDPKVDLGSNATTRGTSRRKVVLSNCTSIGGVVPTATDWIRAFTQRYDALGSAARTGPNNNHPQLAITFQRKINVHSIATRRAPLIRETYFDSVTFGATPSLVAAWCVTGRDKSRVQVLSSNGNFSFQLWSIKSWGDFIPVSNNWIPPSITGVIVAGASEVVVNIPDRYEYIVMTGTLNGANDAQIRFESWDA